MVMKQLDLPSGSRTSDPALHKYKDLFFTQEFFEFVQVVALPEPTGGRPDGLERWVQKQTTLLSSNTRI